jgi:hypothetical protein
MDKASSVNVGPVPFIDAGLEFVWGTPPVNG